MKQFKTVTVKFEDPQHNYKTSVNGECSNESIKQYFVNTSFNVGRFPIENIQKCIGVEIQ